MVPSAWWHHTTPHHTSRFIPSLSPAAHPLWRTRVKMKGEALPTAVPAAWHRAPGFGVRLGVTSSRKRCLGLGLLGDLSIHTPWAESGILGDPERSCRAETCIISSCTEVRPCVVQIGTEHRGALYRKECIAGAVWWPNSMCCCA